jgi:hypothetical protein
MDLHGHVKRGTWVTIDWRLVDIEVRLTRLGIDVWRFRDTLEQRGIVMQDYYVQTPTHVVQVKWSRQCDFLVHADLLTFAGMYVEFVDV